MAISTDTTRLMTNWAKWRSGVPIGVAMSCAYDLAAHGRRDYESEPLLNGEAIDVDTAVERLPPELKDVVILFWTKGGTVQQKANRMRCSRSTFYLRLDHAHERVHDHLRAIRERSERIAAALRPATVPKVPA